jgi:hypothetical protein
MLRVVLVFLAGLLVGANAMYYVMTRQPADAPPRPGPAAVDQPAPPDQAVATGRVRSADADRDGSGGGVPRPTGLIVPVQGLTAAQLSIPARSRSDGRARGHRHRRLRWCSVADGSVETVRPSRAG